MQIGNILYPTKGFEEVAIRLIIEEFSRATKNYGEFNSAHEGFAVIHEEFDELKAEVWRKKKNPDALVKEAVQLGAMAFRFLVDVSLPALEKYQEAYTEALSKGEIHE